MKPSVIIALLAIIGAQGMLDSGQALAYKRSETEGGKPLFWGEFPIPYKINEVGSAEVPLRSAVYEAIKKGFQVWPAVPCTCLTFSYGGTTSDTFVGYDQKNPDEDINLVVFRRSWRYQASALAVTTNIFDKATGRVVAFDLELNNDDYRYTVNGKPYAGQGTVDIQNTVTHEVGHVLGLDHSDVADSTMHPTASLGETSKRTLEDDDKEGLCRIYPKENGCGRDGPPLGTNGQNLDRGCGCSSSKADVRPVPILLAAGLWLLLLTSIRRRRRRAHSTRRGAGRRVAGTGVAVTLALMALIAVGCTPRPSESECRRVGETTFGSAIAKRIKSVKLLEKDPALQGAMPCWRVAFDFLRSSRKGVERRVIRLCLINRRWVPLRTTAPRRIGES